MRVYTCLLSLENHGGDTMKMRPGSPPAPQAVHRQKIIFLLAIGLALSLVSCANSEPWKGFHYPPQPKLPMRQPPFSLPPSPPWNKLIKKYPGLSQTGRLALGTNGGKYAYSYGNVDNHGGLTNRAYYENPVCTPTDLKFVNMGGQKIVILHDAIDWQAIVRNVSRRPCSILDTAPYPGTNGSTLGDCLPAYIVRDSSGRTIYVGDAGSYTPLPNSRRMPKCGIGLAATLILSGKSTNNTGLGGIVEAGDLRDVSGVGPPPGRYSVTAIIPSGAYLTPSNCPLCKGAGQPLIGKVEPIYSPPFYFTIKD